jgi:hypothetical protein
MLIWRDWIANPRSVRLSNADANVEILSETNGIRLCLQWLNATRKIPHDFLKW